MTLFRVAALEGAFELVEHLTAYSDVSAAEGIDQLRNGPSDTARLDYDGAMRLLDSCGPEMFAATSRGVEGRRKIIERLVAVESPGWRLAAGIGKKWCRDAMDENTDQVIGWAGLWDADDAALDWWFEMAAHARGLSDAARAAVGRVGERLTYEHECDRLLALEAPCAPVWRSLEDDTLGYDIESWDYIPGSPPVPLRIEVKAYSGIDRRFFLSRGEWRTALRFNPQYVVDVWNITSKTLTRLGVEQVKQAVPSEVPPGEWQSLLVFPDML